MPIGDLLASITGEKSSSPAPRPAPPPKRKAESELSGSATKTPRTDTTANGTTRTNGVGRPNDTQHSSASRLPERPIASPSTNVKSSSAPPRQNDKPMASSISRNSQNLATRTSSSTHGGRPASASTAVRATVAVDSGPKPPPKKRSYAEIMARATNAQKTLATKVGAIQHKPLEKSVMTKKERAEARALEARQAAKLARQGSARPGAIASKVSRDANGSNGAAKPINGKAANSAGRKGAPPVEEKKVKKAALATTGYQGTARVRPGAASSKPNSSSSRPGADVRDRPRYPGALSSARRRYDDEEDDELDDFIEYDDEEDVGPGYGLGPPRRYDSMDEEDESDMEAGLTDVEEEERRAAAIARREDMEQEALEKRLKREKEEKKRRLMEAAAKRRG
ncbi:hypothetical protein GE09DRAFT_1148236 [Coniochaeta sp. 2T2.1]|nr:hypothetical protein GE09DRAFT_1148236 [Coniochaeta sp. 2T2.1]